jgi:peptidoglycan/LPS O-acetylase OafA/YrhL
MGTLRVLLAISVIMAHLGTAYGWNLVGGPAAVQSFFIISGFYMSLILNEKYVGQAHSFKLFITNRFLRLYPIYLVVLTITVITCLVIAGISHGSNVPVFGTYIDAKPGFTSMLFLVFTNIAIWGQDVVMFLGIHTDTGSLFFTSNFWNTSPGLYSFLFIQQGWSLGLELTFYLVAPLILRKKFSVVLIFIVLAFVLRLFVYYFLQLQNDPWTYRFFPTEIIFFLLGNASYKIYLFLKSGHISKRLGWIVFGVLMLFIVEYPYLPGTPQIIFQYTVKDISYFLMMMLAVPVLFIHFKNNKTDNRIGELSYPIYVSHLLIIRFYDVCNFNGNYRAISVIAVTIILSWLLNRFVAVPVERIRQKRINAYKKVYVVKSQIV